VKTTNGGEEWETTGLDDVSAWIGSIVVNPWDPNHLLAGGRAVPDGFVLYETFDGGATWTTVEPGLDLPRISAMVPDTTGGVFAVYMATFGDGVYRYQSPVSDILDGPHRSSLRVQTIVGGPEPVARLEYRLPSPGVAEVRIFDVLGRESEAISLGHQPAGLHSVTWMPDRTTSGMRICTLYLDRRPLDSARMVFVR
jgi:hypothetical protein